MAKIYGAKKRDYSRKKYKNSLFASKKKKKKIEISIKTKVFVVLILLFIISLIYLFFYSFLFTIEKINIEGTENIDKKQIEKIAQDQLDKRRFLVFSQKNVFAFNKNELKNKISSEVVLEELKIDKKLTSTLNIFVKEKPRTLVWVSQSKYYYMEPNGVIIEKFLDLPQKEEKIKEIEENIEEEAELVELELPEQDRSAEEGIDLPIIYDLSNSDINIGDELISSELVSFILNLVSDLPVELDRFEVLDSKSGEVVVITKEGWKIYFDSEVALDNQITSLNTVLREKISEEQKAVLEYIDVRLVNRVYFK